MIGSPDSRTPSDRRAAGPERHANPDPVPAKVAVIGGGRMGAGIAQSFAAAGSTVVVVERDGRAATTAVERIRSSLAQAAARGNLVEILEDVLARVSTADAPEGLSADTDLVVEAVPEDAALKTRMLRAAEQAVGAHTVLATNTSSLSVTGLGRALARPERFLGMHFFNPVPASELIELVVTPATGEPALGAALAWTRALGKADVVVNDSPGFASTRLGLAIGLEAIRMVQDGVAAPEAVDTAMCLGYKHPVGPLRLTDLVGLDVRLAIAEYLHSTLGERYAPPQLLRDKVARGELGRKSGQGFYPW